MFKLSWEIGVLMNTYLENVKSFESKEYDYDTERQKEAIKELYAQAIELNCQMGYGLVMPIDMAIERVAEGSIIDYDGCGDLLDKDGNKISGMRCDVQFLKRAKENGACFVAWFNK